VSTAGTAGSPYAGNFAIKRDLFWEVGGFDLGYLGHHGSEDQQLGCRLSENG
jgi:predicted glycosyltransferase involved in capsule biosynthesis